MLWCWLPRRHAPGIFLYGASEIIGLLEFRFALYVAYISASSSNQREGERTLTLSDQEIKLDGQTLSQDSEGAVTLSHDIVYYHDNTGIYGASW